MVSKNYSKTGKICRVTFKYPNKENALSCYLAGNFNQWSQENTSLKKLKNGDFSVTVSLTAGHTYAYRYVLDGDVWVTDSEADGYAPNEYGENNSLISV